MGLGSNLNDPAARLDEARQRLSAIAGIEIEQVSAYYATPPVGVTNQPWFVNAVARLRTQLGAESLLASLLTVEDDMGRARTIHWGPRLIDLDLLLYNDLVLETPTLTLPHPEMHRRGFVLIPLAEIAPHAWHPGLQQTITQLLAQLEPAARVAHKL
ncbi:MAG: 2-amino-4-hydroxy-6-hydroxymethyldihydropteridine diphosphokinase [Desulfobacca sp.]|nr:2-amino-4-hydroxy-6-hydroxymethyldihydropteridine diphosphokinase [Desulfobacca sp.]